MIRAVIIGFVLLEASNVIALYFFPGTKYANSVGVFKGWEKSKEDPEIHDFVKYLVNWVAGTKLIFLLLLIGILMAADDQGLFFAGLALVIAISSFYWRLFPLIRKMDRAHQIAPSGYSIVLGGMIALILCVFLVAVVISGTG